MPDAKPESDPLPPGEDLEAQLEEGLEDSFPASEPPSAARRHRAPPGQADKPA